MSADPHASGIQQGGVGTALALQRGTLSRVPGEQEGDPFLRILFLGLFSAIFVIGLSFATALADSVTMRVLQFSHISTPVLAVGLLALARRYLWVAFGLFLVAFIVSELIFLTRIVPAGWTAMGLLKGLVLATITGGLAGLAARWAVGRQTHVLREIGPVSPALVAGGLVFAIGAPLGLLALWIDLAGQANAESFDRLAWLLIERQFRIGLIAVGAGLMLTVPPTVRALPEIVAHILAFVALGLAVRAGYSLLPVLDAPLLGLILVIVRPIRVAIPGVMGGISLFVLLTGVYVDLPDLLTPMLIQQGLIADAVMLLLVLLALVRVRSTLVLEGQMQILGRMARAQELARYGYFVYDAASDRAVFDHLTQKILNVPAQMAASGFLSRVHPEDRVAVARAGDGASEESYAFSFRFAMDGDWSPDCDQRNFSGFKLGERQPDGRCIAYGLLLDVTHEHVQEQHLRLVLNELSERQGQQKQLFSVISHELRTPASILSMIADELDEGRPWAEAGPRMRAVLDQLLSIMSDMRQAVLPEQNLPVRIETVCPAEVVHSVANSFRPMANLRGIMLRSDLAPEAELPRSFDRIRLTQTLSNLVKNAILHSQATELRIAYDEGDDGFATWTVGDNGRNLPLEQRDRLFQPFVRGAGGGMKTDGSGLGLYIAKGAIELLGGTLDYIDRPLSGAEFRIRLPLHVAPSQASAPVPAAPALPATEGLTVLLLEDSEPMGELLTARLGKSFAAVHWLRDGAAGLDWLGQNAVDLVITDLYMPGMSGDELVRILRQRAYDKPLIGMTAADLGPDVERFLAAGADVVLSKPLKVEAVRVALGRLADGAPAA